MRRHDATCIILCTLHVHCDGQTGRMPRTLNGLHASSPQAQNCSVYTTASTCVAKQLTYSGPATVLNATTTFPVTLTTSNVQSFTAAFTAALSLRCALAKTITILLLLPSPCSHVLTWMPRRYAHPALP